METYCSMFPSKSTLGLDVVLDVISIWYKEEYKVSTREINQHTKSRRIATRM